MRWLILLLLLTGCDFLNGEGTTPETTVTTGSRPSDAPDVVVLAASGHEFTVNTALYRDGYLIRDGAALDVASALEGQGFSVFVWDHGDALWNHDAEGNQLGPADSGEAVSFGFLQLIADLEFIRDTWIASYDNPTRIVVLGHSHGVVWAHLAMNLVTDAPVDVLIDLDGDVEGWDSSGPMGVAVDSWDQWLVDFTNTFGVEWAFDVWSARSSWPIIGDSVLRDIEDVVPTSATLNLEVWGGGQLLRDTEPNIRLDGTETDILRLETKLSHEALARGNTEATIWIAEQLAAFYGG
jgi:hypothetical protein